MKKRIRFTLLSLLFLFSCKKNTSNEALIGDWIWTIQYANNPGYNTTPQSTGIQEYIYFGADKTYSLKQNDVIVNSGTYKMATATSSAGKGVSSILYTNSRVVDSAAYYMITDKDSLIISHDLIGTVGSGVRYYGRKNE